MRYVLEMGQQALKWPAALNRRMLIIRNWHVHGTWHTWNDVDVNCLQYSNSLLLHTTISSLLLLILWALVSCDASGHAACGDVYHRCAECFWNCSIKFSIQNLIDTNACLMARMDDERQKRVKISSKLRRQSRRCTVARILVCHSIYLHARKSRRTIWEMHSWL